MFFKRHLKQGREIGQNTLAMLKSASMGTSFESFDGFNPPSDFFNDAYINGFLTSYVGNAMAFGLGANSWSREKKGECVYSAFSEIDPTNILHKGLIREIELDQAELERGLNDGTTVMGLTYQKLKSDDPDPKVIEAKKLAEDLANQNAGSSPDEHLAAAALLVTLRQHIQSKWGR